MSEWPVPVLGMAFSTVTLDCAFALSANVTHRHLRVRGPSPGRTARPQGEPMASSSWAVSMAPGVDVSCCDCLMRSEIWGDDAVTSHTQDGLLRSGGFFSRLLTSSGLCFLPWGSPPSWGEEAVPRNPDPEEVGGARPTHRAGSSHPGLGASPPSKVCDLPPRCVLTRPQQATPGPRQAGNGDGDVGVEK